MDGLAAIGLGANILQFVEVAVRLVSDAHDISRSASGQAQEYVELGKVAEDLTQLTNGFILPVDKCESMATVHNRIHSPGIQNIATLARDVAQELIAATNHPDCKNRKWRSFLQALKFLWRKDRIEGLQKRLGDLRNELSIQIQSTMSNQLEVLRTDLGAVRSHCEALGLSRSDDIRDVLYSLQTLNKLVVEGKLHDIQKAIEIISEATFALQTFDKERRMLKSLTFENMSDRYHTIADAHARTFHWIFEPSHLSPSDPRAKIHFRKWLTSGDGFYWIAGKPGSGKSTLMKYLQESPQTSTCLQQWARDESLIIAHSYFWGGGNDMQRCQRGLLQQLLFETLRQCPAFIPDVCAHHWQHDYVNGWSLRELLEAVGRLHSTTAGHSTKFCFFIDGLDEYEGDEWELVQVLKSITASSRIKMCVSSRRSRCFEHAFGASQVSKLYLEHLTVNDIREFAEHELQKVSGFDSLRKEKREYDEFVSAIIRRAEGVFLWVVLVVRSLREGYQNGDNISLLRERLENRPSELSKLFDELLRSVDTIYLRDMAITFEVAVRIPRPMCALSYWFLDEENRQTCNWTVGPGFSEIGALEDEMINRLTGRYKGLLEPTGKSGSRKIQFIHRSVRDYLTETTVRRLFEKPDLHPSTHAFRAFVIHAKFGGSNMKRRGFNTQDLEHLIIFARLAEEESSEFDWQAFEALKAYISGWFVDYNVHMLCLAVRFGFIAYLQRRYNQDRTLIRRHSACLLEAALEAQDYLVNSVFGVRSSYETLVWLLKNGADPNIKCTDGTIFKRFLSETGALARRSKRPWVYEQWQHSLHILLVNGASIEDVFADSRFLEALPQLGYINDTGIHNLADSGLLREERVHKGLNRHLDMYSAFLALERGLNPNRRIGSLTLWQTWLCHICRWQLDHGALEDICVRAMKLFLAHGADPFASVYCNSDRIKRRAGWSVTQIVNTFFEEHNRRDMGQALDSAKRRWSRQGAGELMDTSHDANWDLVDMFCT